ncbi:MAG TPA: hypothetical protein VGJ60_09215 [Chloroflexota bacterium]|jgi:hypothetical protein
MRASARAFPVRHAQASALEGLDAMARLARESGMVAHVLLPRAPGVVEHARRVALREGVAASVDLRAVSVRVRFDPLA